MAAGPTATPHPREWMPHLWQGCNLASWLRLLGRNHFAVQPPYWYIAAIATGSSVLHETLRGLQYAWFGDKIDRTPIPHAPLFIIGHWRTGTTLLHELLILDDRHTSPNTYQCLAPHHFLLTEQLFKRLFWFLMPSRRPMDNMPMSWDRPQEDEFALCLLGQPSPYATIAFPNHPPQDQLAFDLETSAGPGSWELEAGLPPLPAPSHLQRPAPADPQVADAQLPHSGAAGTFSRRPLCAHRPRSLRGVLVHGEPVEVAL